MTRAPATAVRGAIYGCFFALTLCACSPHYQRTPVVGAGTGTHEVDISKRVEDACSALMRDAREVDRAEQTLLVVSFADLNALEHSSPLGRLLGQQCGSKIVDKGYQVTEILLAESLYIDPAQGELLLSRDLEQIAANHDADTVVVGTYTVARQQVYVTAKVVRSRDARILAAINFELPVNNEVQSLLGR